MTVTLDTGAGNLPLATITTRDAMAEVYLYGAHVTRYERKGTKPVLFLSEKSLYQRGKAIRGGIPVIFPWFGAHPSDSTKGQHGFARTTEWRVVSSDGPLVLGIESDDATRAVWPHDFVARLTVTVDERLTVALEVENTSREPFSFEAALHTYIAVGDVGRVSVRGLENTEYIDKTDSMKRKRLGNEPLVIERETDSVFVNTTAACVVDDPVWNRRITVEKSGSRSTVVWNPYAAKAKALADFGDDEWQNMICVETANAGENAVRLAPGERVMMSTTISAT